MFFKHKTFEGDVFPIDKLILILSFAAFYYTTRILGVQNTEKKVSRQTEPNFFKKNAFDDDYMDEHNETFYDAQEDVKGLEEAIKKDQENAGVMLDGV